ncbi:MAG: pyridoxamine 5'-phosphate oxidase family protein [Candidatus Phaeomarinobacter sp.]
MTDTTIVDATNASKPAVEGAKPDYYSQLDAAETMAWDMLEQGAKSSKQPFHTPVLATVNEDGAPQARTIVMRQADRTMGILRGNTDQRSPKARQLANDSRVQLLFYDVGAKVQLRVTATADLVTEGSALDEAWTASAPGSKVCYLAQGAPGTAQETPTSGLPDFADLGQRVAPEKLEAGLNNFATIRFKVEALDWLYLDSKGHRRAKFDYIAGTKSWVIP